MVRRTLMSLLPALALLCACENRGGHDDHWPVAAAVETRSTAPPGVAFDWFEYTGDDEIFRQPLSDGHYQNPVVAGFFPDPSIVRRDQDYYMVHSSFSYAPGVPVLHSTNLVDWRLIGHALTRPQQLDLHGQPVSRGIFAPTIRYHDGTFYLITTAIDTGGNFYVTAPDPAGPWSDPYWLPEIDGIDPDIFFDADGRVYITHNGPPQGEPLYDGHRAIWRWEYDLDTRRVVPASGRVIVDGGVDLSSRPVWIEAPHIFRIGEWYYLICAEGGTGYDHSEVVFRSRDLEEPFVPWAGNPILTQRDLAIDREHPVTTAGHADLVQTPAGDWWAVFLATRAYDRTFYNSGRETFLLPVAWQDGWPVILPRGRAIPYRLARPRIAASAAPGAPLTGNFTWRDEFDGERLNLHWNLLRGFDASWLERRGGQLLVEARAVGLSSLGQPAYLGRRQQHTQFRSSAQLRLPRDGRLSAGLAALQNETHHYYLGVRRAGDGYRLFLEQAAGAEPRVVREATIRAAADDPLVLEIAGNGGSLRFSYRLPPAEARTLADGVDGRVLSTAVAGGFVGTTLGPHVRLESE